MSDSDRASGWELLGVERPSQRSRLHGVNTGERASARCGKALSARSRQVIWARAAGRCEYRGCNKILIGDLISGYEDKNFGFVAHIVADSPMGPRGDAVRSLRLSDEVSNLMLLCATHHKLIDVDEPKVHSEECLLSMKSAHETRVEITTGITRERASQVLRYSAKIGDRETPMAFGNLAAAMLPECYPAEGRRTLDIEIQGTDYRDDEEEYWRVQCDSLRRQFRRKVQERIESRDVGHLSVFALAPQPLLIELGRLLGDVIPMNVYQLHREPKSWRWQDDGEAMEFETRKPETVGGPVALVLALSATVNERRIVEVLGGDAAIWTIQAKNAHNDAMRRGGDLRRFRELVRRILNDIKEECGENERIHVFPALPVSAAVEVGRVWMPKADLPMIVYDQNRMRGGFFSTIQIC